MKIIPSHDKILVEPEEVKGEKKYGSIIMPDINTERPTVGRVVRTSPGYFDNGTFVPAQHFDGDRIMYGKYSGVDVEFENKKYVFIRFSDVLARIDDGKEIEE
jgi:chaperonin GroES